MLTHIKQLLCCTLLALIPIQSFAIGSDSPSEAVLNFLSLTQKGKVCEAFEYVDPADLKEITELIQHKMEVTKQNTVAKIKLKFGNDATWKSVKSLPPSQFFCRALVGKQLRSKKYGGSGADTDVNKIIKEASSKMKYIGSVNETDNFAHVIVTILSKPNIDSLASTVKRNGKWYMLMDQTKKNAMKARYAK